MKRAFLAILCAAAATSYAQQQPNQEAERIEQPRQWEQLRPAGEAASERQSNWIDEAATLAGSSIAGQDRSRLFSPSAPEVRLYVAQLTNTTLTPGSLPQAAEMLCTEDRGRVADQLKQLDLSTHDLIVTRFRSQWKTRYGEEFDLAKQRAVVSEYYVLRGLRSPEEAIVAAHQPPGANGESHQTRPEEHPQEQERAATVVIPPNPEEKQPAMILMLANETTGGSNWRLNTPNSLSADKLRQNLDDRLTRFLDGQAKWPADAREAYRIIGYHVLATFNDQPVDRPKQEPQQPTPQQPDNPSLET